MKRILHAVLSWMVVFKIINKFFNNEKMLMTFPRLTVEDSNGNIIRVSELYPELRTNY